MAVAVLSLLTVVLLILQNGHVHGTSNSPLLPPNVKLTDAELFGSEVLDSAHRTASLLESGTPGDLAEALPASQRLVGSPHLPKDQTGAVGGRDHPPREVGDTRRLWGPRWPFHPLSEGSKAETQGHPTDDGWSRRRGSVAGSIKLHKQKASITSFYSDYKLAFIICALL